MQNRGDFNTAPPFSPGLVFYTFASAQHLVFRGHMCRTYDTSSSATHEDIVYVVNTNVAGGGTLHEPTYVNVSTTTDASSEIVAAGLHSFPSCSLRVALHDHNRLP